MSPNISQAVAQSRIDDFVRDANRRRHEERAGESQHAPAAPLKSIRYARRLRVRTA